MPRQVTPPTVRFPNYVDKNGPIPPHRPELGPCWIWTGGLSRRGYGKFWVDAARATVPAHIFAWESEHGPAATGLLVCHKCDWPPCVRESHLFLGTPLDNTADMWAKGRQRVVLPDTWIKRGETNYRSKLVAAQVLEIRQRYAAGGITTYQLAEDYPVGPGNIQCIIRGETWQHLLPT